MGQVEIRVNLSGISATPAEFERLKVAIVRWAQVGWSRTTLNRMKRKVPVRSGRLRRSLTFRKLKRGGRFAFTKRGFYWYFQDGLEEELVEILKNSCRTIIPWAIRQARREVGV